jgi:hypothetical protein
MMMDVFEELTVRRCLSRLLVEEVLESIMLIDIYYDFPTYSEGILG